MGFFQTLTTALGSCLGPTLTGALRDFFGIRKTAAKRKPIPKRIREEVWTKYCGDKETGACYVCHTKVLRRNRGWDCSHVHADALGGLPTVANLRVCCPHCNRSMGTQNLYDYKRKRK